MPSPIGERLGTLFCAALSGGTGMTTLQASLHAADRSVVSSRFAPRLSATHGEFPTGDPGVSPGWTSTSWLP